MGERQQQQQQQQQRPSYTLASPLYLEENTKPGKTKLRDPVTYKKHIKTCKPYQPGTSNNYLSIGWLSTG